MDLFRRALGALPDAAWLRRQFTADADLLHDVQHGFRMMARSPSLALSAVFILAVGIGGTLSIVALLDTLDIDARRVAVEHNLTIIRRHRFPEVIVGDGDTVEIVNFVGGG